MSEAAGSALGSAPATDPLSRHTKATVKIS